MIILDFSEFVHSLFVEKNLTKVRIAVIHKNPVSVFFIRYEICYLFTQHQDKPLRLNISIGSVGDRHYELFSSFSP